jgi:hypothetical protein
MPIALGIVMECFAARLRDNRAKKGKRCGGVDGHFQVILWISGFSIVNIIWTCSFESMSLLGAG